MRTNHETSFSHPSSLWSILTHRPLIFMKCHYHRRPAIKRFTSTITGLWVAGCVFLANEIVQAQSISNVSPDGSHLFQPSTTLSFIAASPAGVANITVQLTGTSLPGVTTVTTLTSASGLNLTGTITSRNVSAPLTSNMVYTAVIQMTDANNNTSAPPYPSTPSRRVTRLKRKTGII